MTTPVCKIFPETFCTYFLFLAPEPLHNLADLAGLFAALLIHPEIETQTHSAAV
jgi:hypothetical protein